MAAMLVVTWKLSGKINWNFWSENEFKNMQISTSYLLFLIAFSNQAMLLVLLYKILWIIDTEFLVNFRKIERPAHIAQLEQSNHYSSKISSPFTFRELSSFNVRFPKDHMANLH